MKKNSLMLFAGIIVSLLTTSSKAQTLHVSQPGSIATTEPLKVMSKAGHKALKNFNKQFEDGPDVKWFTGEETITASMKRDGKGMTIVFDRHGRWLRNMYHYSEAKMPRDVRHTIKTVYYDFDITLVQEIKEGRDTFYVVHLEDKDQYKQVCVFEGAIHILKEFTKQ